MNPDDRGSPRESIHDYGYALGDMGRTYDKIKQDIPRTQGSLLNRMGPRYTPGRLTDRAAFFPPRSPMPNEYATPETYHAFGGGKLKGRHENPIFRNYAAQANAPTSSPRIPSIEEDILKELANFMRDPEFVMEGVLKRLQSKNKEKQKQNQTTNI